MKQNLGDLLARFAPILLTLLLSLSSYWIALQTELSLFEGNVAQDPSKPDYFFNDFHSEKHNLSKGIILTLTGKSAEHIPGPQLLNINQPEALRIDEANQRITLTGDNGTLYINEDVLVTQGNVNARTNNDLRMQSQTLRSDNGSGEISSTVYTVIQQPGRTLNMEGFVYDSRGGILTGDSAVSLTLEPNQQ